MQKIDLFRNNCNTLGFIIVLLITNLFGRSQLLAQEFEYSKDSLKSSTRFPGGQKSESEHTTVYTFSEQTYAEDLEHSHDSLLAYGPFPGLEKLEFTGGTIFYDSEIAEVINTLYRNLDPADPLFDSTSVMADDRLLIKSPILADSKEKFIFAFTWGPSDDFGFDIYSDDKNRTWVGSMGGFTMYVPGNGYVYVEGHTNNDFNHRKKYQFKNGRFVESPQAYYYVGLKTFITAPMKLYSDTTYTEVVASLMENQPVEVLIANFDESIWNRHDFLLRTPFGLTGWARISGTYPRTHIMGIYYAGD